MLGDPLCRRVSHRQSDRPWSVAPALISVLIRIAVINMRGRNDSEPSAHTAEASRDLEWVEGSQWRSGHDAIAQDASLQRVKECKFYAGGTTSAAQRRAVSHARCHR